MQQATTIIVITQPLIILKVLTWCIVITTLIKAVTLTYVISDILIVIFSINISLYMYVYDHIEDSYIKYYVLYIFQEYI